LRDEEKRNEALDVLIEVSRGTIEKERGRKSSGAALKAIITANSRLSEVDLNRADPSDYNALDRQLEQIGKRVTGLRKALESLRAAETPASSIGS
jgi:hypothetical protein